MKTFNIENGVAPIMDFLDQRSFEWFNLGREEKGKPRISAEAWRFLKTMSPFLTGDAHEQQRQKMRELGI